jgi:HJR/Mrr/RecB family endonuclease
VNYKGGDYHLLSTAAMRSAATTDSKDIGADIDGIAAATDGIN